MRLSKSKLLSRFLKFGFSVNNLKSPNKRKFSYEELKKFNESFISFMKGSSFCEGGLQFPSSNHFLFEILNSNTIISNPSLKSYETFLKIFVKFTGEHPYRNFNKNSFLAYHFLIFSRHPRGNVSGTRKP